MSWRAAKSLTTLIDQANNHWPHRNKASDGVIGDASHQARVSDHNPNSHGVVTAWDCTQDPKHGADMADFAERLRRSRDERIKYVIWDHRIFDGDGGEEPWKWRLYSGSDPHTNHLHLSVSATPRLYDDASKWPLFGDIPDPTLRPGDNGPDVKRLQRRLNRYHHRHHPQRPDLAVDGDFGAATRAAVERLETDHGLVVNGIASTSVWHVLDKED